MCKYVYVLMGDRSYDLFEDDFKPKERTVLCKKRVPLIKQLPSSLTQENKKDFIFERHC